MLQEFERIKYMHCSQEHINPVQDFGKLEVLLKKKKRFWEVGSRLLCS